MPLFRFPNTILHFVHIPKSGGSTIESGLRQMGGKAALLSASKLGFTTCTVQHMHAEVHSKLIPPGFYDYGFAVVRNPLDRLVSEYRMRVTEKEDPAPFDEWARKVLRRSRKDPYVFDNHIRPQHEYLTPGIEVFKFEDGIETIMKKVAEKLEVSPPEELPHKRKSEKFDVQISDETVTMVERFYRKDYRLYGYERTIPRPQAAEKAAPASSSAESN